MGILYLIVATLSWSLVGVLVKTAALQFDPYTITFTRFIVGVLALAVFVYATRNSIRPATLNRWIWIGALGKSSSYFFENLAISIGYAYGNVLIQPIQTIVLLFAGLILFKDKLTPKSWIAAAVVLLGVMLISLNGRPFLEMFEQQGWITLFFVFSGFGAAFHFLSQKMLLDAMGDVSMNYSIFLWASFLTAIPLPFTAEWTPVFLPGAWASAIALGLITGVSFLLLSKALRQVKFSIAVIVSNLAALFTVLWAGLFLKEPITGYIVAGAVIVVAGMIMLNLPARTRDKETG